MSKWYIITPTGYIETKNPPHHDHWAYDKKTDAYYEEIPHDKKKG